MSSVFRCPCVVLCAYNMCVYMSVYISKYAKHALAPKRRITFEVLCDCVCVCGLGGFWGGATIATPGRQCLVYTPYFVDPYQSDNLCVKLLFLAHCTMLEKELNVFVFICVWKCCWEIPSTIFVFSIPLHCCSQTFAFARLVLLKTFEEI